MTFEELLSSAGSLTQPSEKSTAEFRDKSEQIASELNRRMSLRPDLERLVGAENLLMMEDNSRNMTRFLGSLFNNFQPRILVETVRWVFRAYRSHGFELTFWSANLDTALEVLKDTVSTETYDELYSHFEWLIIHIPDFVHLSDADLSKPGRIQV